MNHTSLGIRAGLVAMGLAGASALAACGTAGTPASSRHVVPTTSMPAPGLVSSSLPNDTTPQGASGSNPVDGAAAVQAIDQIQGEMGSLDNNLSQVSSDLSSPQGDS